MYPIDFLPEEYRHRRATRRQQFRRLVLLAVAAGGLMGVSFLLHLCKVRLQEQLDLIQPVHATLCAQNKQFSTLQGHLQSLRAMAELLGYLRHPWPRTQILFQLFNPLPDTLTLEQVSIERQPPENQPPTRPLSRSEQEAEKSRLAAMPPASRDRRRLQQECDPMQTVVRVSGSALDVAALHGYLAALEKSHLFTKVQLMNVEKSGDQQGLRFQVKIVVRPGYGQAGGPTTSATTPSVVNPPALPMNIPRQTSDSSGPTPRDRLSGRTSCCLGPGRFPPSFPPDRGCGETFLPADAWEEGDSLLRPEVGISWGDLANMGGVV